LIVLGRAIGISKHRIEGAVEANGVAWRGLDRQGDTIVRKTWFRICFRISSAAEDLQNCGHVSDCRRTRDHGPKVITLDVALSITKIKLNGHCRLAVLSYLLTFYRMAQDESQ
jgi:hypothetical protein